MAAAFDWGVLTGGGWTAKVTHDGSHLIGSVPMIPQSFASASDLQTLCNALRELIAAAFDAPADVAPRIGLTVVLDSVASAALSR